MKFLNLLTLLICVVLVAGCSGSETSQGTQYLAYTGGNQNANSLIDGPLPPPLTLCSFDRDFAEIYLMEAVSDMAIENTCQIAHPEAGKFYTFGRSVDMKIVDSARGERTGVVNVKFRPETSIPRKGELALVGLFEFAPKMYGPTAIVTPVELRQDPEAAFAASSGSRFDLPNSMADIRAALASGDEHCAPDAPEAQTTFGDAQSVYVTDEPRECPGGPTAE